MSHIAAIIDNKDVYIFNLRKSKIVNRLTDTANFLDIQYSPNGNYLLGVSTLGELILWETHSYEVLSRTTLEYFNPKYTFKIMFSPGSQKFYFINKITSKSFDLSFYNTRDLAVLDKITLNFDYSHCFRISHDGTTLTFISIDKLIFFSLEDKEFIKSFKTRGLCYQLTFTKDDKYVVFSDEHHSVNYLNNETGRLEHKLEVKDYDLFDNSHKFSRNGRYLMFNMQNYYFIKDLETELNDKIKHGRLHASQTIVPRRHIYIQELDSKMNTSLNKSDDSTLFFAYTSDLSDKMRLRMYDLSEDEIFDIDTPFTDITSVKISLGNKYI